jgi:hypothetical protein
MTDIISIVQVGVENSGKEGHSLATVLMLKNTRTGHSLLFPLFAIRSSLISVVDCINFRAISSGKDPQH